ncbi:MAG TPA: RsmD family RNA methyltransferase [Thermoplasmata archaeon]|jgi:tRNA (guanine10-N2)-dimethyltransferase
MIPGFVELSQESLALAKAEAVSAAEALGGGGVSAVPPLPELVPVEVPDVRAWTELAGRLALARRCLLAVATSPDLVSAARGEGSRGGSAAFRRIGRPSGGGTDEGVLGCGRAFKAGGGTIDLERPSRRFWLAGGAEEREYLLEEVAAVDRRGPTQRRMPLLPFRRPVSLPPKLARAAVNLARVNPSDRVLDPFLGTGALLAEAGLLGGRLYGVDRDPAMVRGALQNLAYLGVAAEELVVGDARDVDFTDENGTFSAIVTDPPYGRSSSTGGEASSELIARVMERWSQRLASDGRLALIVPSGGPPLEIPGTPRFRIPVRVHRSLTREFCLYEAASVRRNSR